MIDIPLGVLVLFMLFMFLLAGMAYEEYIRPKLVMLSLKMKPKKKEHLLIRARKV